MVILPAKLEIVSSDGTRKDIDISQDIMTFGSHSTKCAVTLKRPDISSEHAQIVRNGEGYFLINMDGRNLVTLNSVPIRNRIKQKLRQDDVIALGSDIKLIFKFGSVAPPAASNKINSTHILIGMGILALISVLAIFLLPKRTKPNPNNSNKAVVSSPENINTAPSSVNSEPNNTPVTSSNQANANLAKVADSEQPKSNSNAPGVKVNVTRYEAKMIGIISSISGKDNFVFRENFIGRVVDKLDEYKRNYPDFYGHIKSKSQDINREFDNNGINPKLAYILAFSRNSSKNGKNLFNIPEAPVRRDSAGDNQTKILATYTKDLLGAFEQDYLKTIANLGISVSEAGKINADLNKLPGDYANSKIVDEKRFSEKELSALAAFFAAGLVANSPKDFGLMIPEIGSLE